MEERIPVDVVIPVTARRREDQPAGPRLLQGLFATDLESDLRRARLLAQWMDAKFEFAGVRFGLDAIIGLVPGLGDTLAALIGLYPLMVARRHKLGKWVQTRMAANLLADWAVGLVPLAGDAMDVAFKANLRNVRLLEKAVEKMKAKE